MRKICVSLFVLFAAGVAVVWLAGGYLTRPALAQLGAAPAGSVSVSFESESGSTLRGWFYPVQGSRGSVALMHGVRSNRGSMTARARLVNSLGFSALTFDFQAHGESQGEYITFGDRESFDAQAAVSYLRQQAPDVPVFVIGVSLGGAAALLSVPPLAVDGMVLEAVYPDISVAISNRLAMRVPLGSLATPLFTAQLAPRIGTPASRLRPADSAIQVHTPVLVLAGSRDRHTTVEETQRLYNAFPGKKRLVVFDGAAHVDLMAYDPKLYAAEVGAFLTALGSKVAGAGSIGSKDSTVVGLHGCCKAVECDGSVIYWNQEVQMEQRIAPSVHEFVSGIAEC